MLLNKYIKPIKYGDLIFHLIQQLPLLIWLVYGFQLFQYFLRRKKPNPRIESNFIFSILFLVYSIPFVLAIRNIYYASFVDDITHKFKEEFNKASLPPGFGFCMNTDIDDVAKKQGVLAYWDYACSGDNSKFMYNMLEDLLNRFYYINYAIFLIVILVYNAVSSVNILKSPFIIMNIRFALLLGTIGCLLPIFHTADFTDNIGNLLINSTWITLLTMNTCGFIFIFLAILIGIA